MEVGARIYLVKYILTELPYIFILNQSIQCVYTNGLLLIDAFRFIPDINPGYIIKLSYHSSSYSE